MSGRNYPKRIRFTDVLLLIVIFVLGYALDVQQRKEVRLRAALAQYKNRSHGEVVRSMGLVFPLDWPYGTLLSEAIDRITKQTAGYRNLHLQRIPIYVDPDGLREAGQSLASRVKAPPSGNLTFRKKLQAVLDPLGLACEVKDAAILITCPSRLDEPEVRPGEEKP
jgi:hypothetical protein